MNAANSLQPNVSSIPFVGCESDGQAGPLDAPHGEDKQMVIPADGASRLAYYKAEARAGVLAPRGWHCYGTYGSSGSSLFVSPTPISVRELFTTSWRGFDGPAIQISILHGGTSGRFGVARTIRRVFQTHGSFARQVIDEGLASSTDFPLGPYPNDKLNYKGTEMVEFQTPANTEGLGTDSWLHKNSDPISGVAILYGNGPDLLQVSVRLPSRLNDLIPLILEEAERSVVLR